MICVYQVAAGYALAIPPYYKLVVETPRHQIEMERRHAKMSAPAPAAAKTVVTSYVPVAPKRKSAKALKGADVKTLEDGTIQLSRLANSGKNKRKLKNKREVIAKKNAEIKTLKKQLKHVKGGNKIKLPVLVRRR